MNYKKKFGAALLGMLILGSIAGCSGNQKEAPRETKTEMTEAKKEESGQRQETGMEKTKQGEYHKITQEEAKARMDSGDPITILDVRTQDEFDEYHIPGAILIPNETIGTEALEALPDFDREILVYCRSGNRSRQAAEKLAEAGYIKVYDFGGIKDWTYETE